MKEIKLANNKKIALVDDEDYEMLLTHKWHLSQSGSGYAQTNIKQNNKWIRCLMHKLLVKCKEGFEIDHIDKNSLNNQKNNLRLVTRSQNQMNKFSYKNSSSIYKGVCWHKSTKKWMSRIKINKKEIYLGIFTNEKDAAIAYNNKAKKLFKEFAYLNEV